MKIVVFAMLFFCSTFLNAQIVFEKGFFINENNERIECFIKNSEWRSNPSKFFYKINMDDAESSTATIASVKEFGIDGASRYKRFKINIERSSSQLGKLDNNRNPVFNEEIIFLKFLVEGEANLYSYNDGDITKYFYDTPTIPTEQLISIIYLAVGDQSTKKNNLFRQQLLNNVSCDGMTEKNTFGTISYHEAELTKHFLKYNRCKTGIVVGDSMKKFTGLFNMKVTINLSQASVDVTNPLSFFYNYDTDFTEIMYKIGFEAEHYLPFNKKSWSVFTNPSYNFLNTEYQYYSKSSFFPTNTPFTLKMDYSSIEIPVGVRYHIYFNTNSKIFINLGAGYDFVMDSTIDFSNENKSLVAESSVNISSGTFLFFGAGYSYKNFGAEIRLSGRDLLSSYSSWKAEHKTIGLVFSYKML